MIVAELALLVVIAVAHVASVRHIDAFHKARAAALDEADEGRRLAIYKMQKAAQRTVANSDRAVRKMVDQARGLHEDTRQLHERVDRHVTNLKRGANG